MRIKRSWLPHIGFFVAITALLLFYFFRVGNFLKDPWYRTADADVVFAGQTITLLNGGDLTFIHHPGTAVIAVQTGVHRLAGAFNLDQRNLTHLSETKGSTELARLFTTAVNTGRLLTLPFFFALAITVYLLLHNITGQWWVAFTFTGFIILSKSVLRHAGIIRAEISSILFFYLSVLLFCASRSSRKVWVFGFFLTLSGLALGLALFSKIQIFTAIGLWAPLIVVILATGNPNSLPTVSKKILMLNLGLAIVLILLTPFWGLEKPAFLTPEFYAAMDPNNQAVYGRYEAGEANFWLPVLSVELILLVFAAAIYVFRRQLPETLHTRLSSSSITLNLLAFGIILSIYLVVLPISFSLYGYWNNLNQLLYSTLTNLTSGGRGFLLNTQWSFINNTRQIIGLHDNYSAFGGINVMFIAAVVSLVCLFRLLRLKNKDRIYYLIPIYLFLGAFLIDQVSMLRLQHAYSIYAAYTILPYGLGLGIFTGLELKQYPPRKNLIPALAGLLIFSAGLINLVTASQFILLKYSPVQESPYTEDIAWGIIRIYLPQIEILKSYPELGQKACLTPEQIMVGLAMLQQNPDPPFAAWDFGYSDSYRFSYTRTGSLGTQAMPLSPDGYPLFNSQSGGLYINGADVSQLAEGDDGIGDITTSLWVKILDDPNRSGPQSRTLLFGYNDDSLDLFLISEYSRHSFIGYYAGEAVSYTFGRLFRSIWYHLVLVKDGQKLRLYVNGDKTGEVTLSATHISPSQLPGINLWEGQTTATFKLANVALWLHALSGEEVHQIYQSTIEETSGTPGEKNLCKPSHNEREFLRAEGEARW